MDINFMEEYFKMKNEYEKKIKALEARIEELEKPYRTLVPRETQIRREDIIKVKELRKKGLSYSKIAEEVKWSKATISRILNGIYDVHIEA